MPDQEIRIRLITEIAQTISAIDTVKEKLNQINNPKSTNTISNNLKTDIASATQTLNTFADSYSKVISGYRKQAEEFYRTYKNTGDSKSLNEFNNLVPVIRSLTQEQEHFNNSLMGGTRQMFTAEKAVASLGSSMQRHLSWFGTGLALGGLIGLPSELINSITKIDSQMAGIRQVLPSLESTKAYEDMLMGYNQKILDLNKALGTDEKQFPVQQMSDSYKEAVQNLGNMVTEQERVNQQAQEYINIAARYGAVTDEVLEAAKAWGRAYKEQQTVNVLVSQSAKMATIDNFAMKESVNGLEATMSQFGMRARDSAEALQYTERIIDAVTAVSHKGQVAAVDLMGALQRSGNAAHQVGVDFEFLLALIGAGARNTARLGGEIGRLIAA